MAERELGAATARVEGDDGPIADPHARRDGEIRQPALVRTRDHLERQAGTCSNRRHDVGPVTRHPGARRTDDGDGLDVEEASLVRHLADHSRGPLERLGADLAGRLETLAEAGHDRPIDDRAPRAAPVSVELRDVELDRVRADIDDGVALGHLIDEQP